MTFSFIHQLLDNGISEEEIIASLSKQIPSFAKKATRMFSGGWSPRQVLDSFSKDKDVQKTARKGLKPVTPAEIAAMRMRNSYDNIPQSEGQESRQNLTEFTKKAAPIALAAVGSQIAAPMAEAALGRALPQMSNLLRRSGALEGTSAELPQALPPNLGTGQAISSNVIPSQPPVNAPSMPQVAPAVQPERIPSKLNIKDLLSKHGILKRIDQLKEAGTSNEEIAKFVKETSPLEMSKLEKETGESADKLISQYLSESVSEQEKAKPIEAVPNLGQMGKDITGNLYNGLFESLKKGSTKFAGIEDPLLKAAKSEFDAGNIKSPEDLKKFANERYQKPIEKNATVISPQGVGEVKAIRNGKAIVEIDGKKHQIDEDELESSPIPEKDLDDLYDDLLRGIEKETGEDVSRMVQWAGYNPETNTLQFLPHTGDLYTYDDISEEDAALLRDVLSVRKTSGSNFIGAWKKDSKSPIGAALSKLIRKLQSERGGKGQEYSAKHGTIYSAYEPAIQAKKKKKKK